MLSIALKIVMISSIATALSSCAVYSSGFGCSDSKGAKCMMLSKVDEMVDSGEIEEVYKTKQCKKGKCKRVINQPPAKSKEYRIRLEENKADELGYKYNDEYLYIK